MASFAMCPACSREYHDPANRRFHAQPNACPTCGPRVSLLDAAGEALAVADPIKETCDLLGKRKIVAIKGLGGFHLACDAHAGGGCRAAQVEKIPGRQTLCPDVPGPRGHRTALPPGRCRARPARGERAPHRHPPAPGSAAVAPSVAPGQRTLGVMLPYTPLHHLLLADGPACLVMTSGNRSDEPIAFRNDEAVEQLRGIADFFLVHDREIHTRLDDSVIKPFPFRGNGGNATFLRRARGFCPAPIQLTRRSRQHNASVLACGAELKNTICLTQGEQCLPEPPYRRFGELRDHALL